jgi:hypothetical protein
VLDVTAEEAFRRWYVPWKYRICDEVSPFSHGTVLRSRRYPDVWEYNCLRLNRPMETGDLIAVADREFAGCAHRLVEWLVPMPDRVVRELREQGWMADPLIYMRHDGRMVLEVRRELVEVEYDAVLELRHLWHREDFGDHTEAETLSGAGPRGRRTRRCPRDRGDRQRSRDRLCPSGDT